MVEVIDFDRDGHGVIRVDDEIVFSGEGEDYEQVRLECLTKCLECLDVL